MNSNKNSLGLESNAQDNGHNQSSSTSQQEQDNTISLVYPDGRVTNVKVRQQQSSNS